MRASRTEQSHKPTDTRFSGQPGVLANLFGVQVWEPFSFYGMQGIVLIHLYQQRLPIAVSASARRRAPAS